MNFNNEQDKKLFSDVVEKSLNNTAAINILVDIVCRSGLITIDDFNKRVSKEAEEIKQDMIKKVSK